MLYWSAGDSRYIHRTNLVGDVRDQQFVDVTDDVTNDVTAAAVQDIVIDVTTHRYLMHVHFFH